MRRQTLASQSAVSFLALLLTTCGGDAPTGPTRETREPAASSGHDVSSLSAQADWTVEVVRAPTSGQTFRVNKQGGLPQPGPKFRFKATAPVDIPEGTFKLVFLTAAGKQCGLASVAQPIAFAAHAPRTIDISNAAIQVGPDACVSIGESCSTGQCRFPLTTTKLRVLFGDGSRQLAQTTEDLQYEWNDATPSSGGHQSLTCGGTPVPDTVACGVPTALCTTGTFVCNTAPCHNHGFGLVCGVCPGPFCDPRDW
jgi:hypothetical protein